MLQQLSLSLRYLVLLDTALWYRATSIVTLSIPAISLRGGYTGSILSQPTQSVPGRQPITKQLLVAQGFDNEPKWRDAGKESMYSQDAEYDDDGSSEESIEENAENVEIAEDNLLGDYEVQRPIETEYEFVESQPPVISLSDTPTRRSDIQIRFPVRTTPSPELADLVLRCSPTCPKNPCPPDQVLSRPLQAPSQLQHNMSSLQIPC